MAIFQSPKILSKSAANSFVLEPRVHKVKHKMYKLVP